jgi:hypothetical protein
VRKEAEGEGAVARIAESQSDAQGAALPLAGRPVARFASRPTAALVRRDWRQSQRAKRRG